MNNSVIDTARVIPGPGALVGGDRSMGAMLIDAGKLTPEGAERVLRHAKERGLRFGDAALALQLVSVDDIQHALAKQFDYPYLSVGQSGVSKHVVAAWSPFSPQVEALRAVRSQLLLRWFSGEPERHCIAIVSANSGDGRSYLAANLAVVFSQLGERTLLIDADLRHPCQHDLFGLGNTVGLSTVLAERAGQEAIQRVPAFVDLSVLTSGPTPPNPLELLGRASFANLMAEVSKTFDVVVLDTPAANVGSDFQHVTAKCVGALMVARKNKTSADACMDISDGILAANATLVGCVLNEH